MSSKFEFEFDLEYDSFSTIESSRSVMNISDYSFEKRNEMVFSTFENYAKRGRCGSRTIL